MKRAFLLLCIASTACSSKNDGPVPTVNSVTPDLICTAQADVTVTIQGSGFSPAVVKGLNLNPRVVMPRVLLVPPSGAELEVPPANVSLPDGDTSGTRLEAIIPQGLASPSGPGEPSTVYGIRVVNPNGNEDTTGDLLTIVPPPDLVSVQPTSGAQGTVVTVTLTGTGFRAGMTVTLDAVPAVAGTNVTITSDTSATADFDLTNVAAGTYGITVTNAEGCSDTLPGAFTVFVPKEIAVTGIDPPFGCTCSPTSVTISGAGGFVSTPRVEMRPHGQSSPVIKFERVAFIDSSTLTAVVPPGAPVGDYDVTVINPPTDGGIGTLENGFRVVAMPIPRIEAIVPDRGSLQQDTAVSVFGENFRDPVTIELIDPTGAVDATIANITPVSANQLDLTIPTMTMTEDVYLVRVTNQDENTFSTFSNFLVADNGPSGNLSVFQQNTPLNTGRRILAGTQARDDLGNRYVYAIGGDTGAGGTVLDTVEVSQLSKFGNLGDWSDMRNTLNTPRVGAHAVSVPVFDTDVSRFVPVKTYIYVTGGRSDTGMVLATVERAQVLAAADAPRITGAAASMQAGTLADGTWYYKVSAVLAAGDPDNPGGETLPSDEAIITIGGGGGAIDLSWDAVTVNGMPAAEYRIYRTDEANGASQTEHLIATTTDTSYTDTGDAAGTESPLPPGATGVWVEMTSGLGQARWGHQTATLEDDSGSAFLYVIGGKSDDADGYLGGVEYAPIAADGSLGSFSTANATALAAPRAFFSLVVETTSNVSTFGTGARLMAIGGVGVGGTGLEIESSLVTTGGGNGAWADYGGGGPVPRNAGQMCVIAHEKLIAMGGASQATDTTFSQIRTKGSDVQFDNNGDLDSPFSDAANGFTGPRALGVAIIGSGYIYFVGGSSDGSNALATTERTF